MTANNATNTALFAAARDAEQRGDALRAITLYEQLLSAVPQEPVVWTRLGVLHSTGGAAERAIAAFEVAASLLPNSAAAAYNLGRALTAANRLAEAITQFERAIALQPNYPEAYLALLSALPNDAPITKHIELCERAKAISGQYPQLHIHHGIKLHEAQRYEEAIQQFVSAKAADRTLLTADFGQANALHALGRYREAIALFDRILTEQPNYHDARVNRGLAEAALGNVDDALASYTLVLNNAPDHAIARRASGFACLTLRRFEVAITHLQRALELDPNDTEACEALGDAYAATNFNQNARECFRYLNEVLEQKSAKPRLRIRALNRQLDQSITLSDFQDSRACCQKLEALEAASPYVLGRDVLATLFRAEWHDFVLQRTQLLDAARACKPTCSPFTLLAVTDDPLLHKNYARSYIDWGFPNAGSHTAPLPRTAAQRLRVGYVSPDFRDHPVGQLMAPLFESHNRERFSITAFSLWPESASATDEPTTTRRLRAACDQFINLDRYNDTDAAAVIREQGIDILIDLAGHTSGARTGIFSLRPAAIQVNYLGYPSTLGASFYDYIIGDHYVTPEAHAASYSEQIVPLAGSYLPPGDRSKASPQPTSRALCGLPDGALVLGAFHTTYKIMPEVFNIWLRLLVDLPDSILWLTVPDTTARAMMLKQAQKLGLSASRLVFADRVPNTDAHLARLQSVDLLLDTYPYGSHSAAMDALWAGVPILTCEGESFASRVCAGLLREIDLPELVATSLADYERIGRHLIADRSQLTTLRARLANKRTHPLFDATHHVKTLEEALEWMWATSAARVAQQ